MPLQSSPNNDFTLSLLNYLQAGLNGKYVYFKTLDLLGVSQQDTQYISIQGNTLQKNPAEENPPQASLPQEASTQNDQKDGDTLKNLASDINLIQSWLSLLMEEEKPLFDLEWSSAKTPEAQDAFLICDRLIKDLDTHSFVVEGLSLIHI